MLYPIKHQLSWCKRDPKIHGLKQCISSSLSCTWSIKVNHQWGQLIDFPTFSSKNGERVREINTHRILLRAQSRAGTHDFLLYSNGYEVTKPHQALRETKECAQLQLKRSVINEAWMNIDGLLLASDSIPLVSISLTCPKWSSWFSLLKMLPL